METPDVYTEVETRHERVRRFVEQQYPGCHVTDIREDAKSTFAKKRQTRADYVLARVSVDYEVKTRHEDDDEPSINCRVAVESNGTLHIVNFDYIHYMR